MKLNGTSKEKWDIEFFIWLEYWSVSKSEKIYKPAVTEMRTIFVWQYIIRNWNNIGF